MAPQSEDVVTTCQASVAPQTEVDEEMGDMVQPRGGQEASNGMASATGCAEETDNQAPMLPCEGGHHEVRNLASGEDTETGVVLNPTRLPRSGRSPRVRTTTATRSGTLPQWRTSSSGWSCTQQGCPAPVGVRV